MSKQASASHPGILSSVWGTHINYKERNYSTKLVSDLYMHDVALGMHTQLHTGTHTNNLRAVGPGGLFNIALWRQRQVDLFEFGTSLVHMASSRPVSVTSQFFLFGKKRKREKMEETKTQSKGQRSDHNVYKSHFHGKAGNTLNV